MSDLVTILLVLTVLTNVRLLGTSRLGALIAAAAFQGLFLGLLPLLLHAGALTPHLWAMALAGIALKAVIFPRLLTRAVRETEVRRETAPLVGYSASLLVGLLMLGLSVWLARRLPLPQAGTPPLVAPVAFFTVLCGLFLLVARRKAIAQVLGYLVFENGVYAFGAAIAHEQPLLVETGVLLDLFVAVFVMGIAVFDIQREFDHMDVDRLADLRDAGDDAKPRSPEVRP
jgi:hydrogenase-4 component E